MTLEMKILSDLLFPESFSSRVRYFLILSDVTEIIDDFSQTYSCIRNRVSYILDQYQWRLISNGETNQEERKSVAKHIQIFDCQWM